MTQTIVGHGWHLAKRFATSIKPGPPNADDERWAEGHLGAGELDIWRSMNNPDRRHAVGVARAVVAELGADVDRGVVAAALLHDSGKVVSGFRTPARVVATVFWGIADDRLAGRWQEASDPIRRRLAQYRLHPELGGQALVEAGADPLTSAWAREHHRPEREWTVPIRYARVLKDCDDD